MIYHIFLCCWECRGVIKICCCNFVSLLYCFCFCFYCFRSSTFFSNIIYVAHHSGTDAVGVSLIADDASSRVAAASVTVTPSPRCSALQSQKAVTAQFKSKPLLPPFALHAPYCCCFHCCSGAAPRACLPLSRSLILL